MSRVVEYSSRWRCHASLNTLVVEDVGEADRWWLVAFSVPSHSFNQYWHIVNWNEGNIIKLTLNQNKKKICSEHIIVILAIFIADDETADDFLIDQASCPGDLIVADYTLTYFETTGSEVCAFDFSSSAAIGTQDHAITVFSCTDVATYCK